MVLTRDQTCYVWGGDQNSFCPYARPSLLTEFEKKVLEASIGDNFIILMDYDNLVYSCGKNDKG